MKYRELAPNQAHIVFWNDVYHIYRPDGYYAREVMTTRTLCAAVAFCRKNGWEIIQ